MQLMQQGCQPASSGAKEACVWLAYGGACSARFAWSGCQQQKHKAESLPVEGLDKVRTRLTPLQNAAHRNPHCQLALHLLMTCPSPPRPLLSPPFALCLSPAPSSSLFLASPMRMPTCACTNTSLAASKPAVSLAGACPAAACRHCASGSPAACAHVPHGFKLSPAGGRRISWQVGPAQQGCSRCSCGQHQSCQATGACPSHG